MQATGFSYLDDGGFVVIGQAKAGFDTLTQRARDGHRMQLPAQSLCQCHCGSFAPISERDFYNLILRGSVAPTTGDGRGNLLR